MNLEETKKIINAGLAWANWTDEQQEAMREALKCVRMVELIKDEAEQLYAEEIDLSDFGERVMNII
ncbi:hypothetical protein [Lysinibacillus sphaericus]|uniref:hypothetical protein n=1 Tax=Lysinibacillus sphaericus TaxID=1421 RepID=UPI00055AA739|nr:hypothetical protein [Lysinibacillus sphaericus]